MKTLVSAVVGLGAAAALGGAAWASSPVDRAAGIPTTPEQAAARALPPAANVAPAGEPDPEQAHAPYAVKGFRSALFGMDQAEVRAAIARDFGPAQPVYAGSNAAEGTTWLIVKTPLPPAPGQALVSYILGATAHRLIHVNVIWSTEAAPTAAERQRIAAAGLQLGTYFRKQAWPTKPTRTGLTRDGFLLFEAADSAGASITVKAKGVVIVRRLNGKVETSHPTGPATLELSFAQDPAHPDVASIASKSLPSP